MNRRAILLYILFLLVPTLLVGAVLARLLAHERERLARAGRIAAEEQARAVASQCVVAVDDFKAGILEQLAALRGQDLPAALRDWERRDPLVRNVFIIQADHTLAVPDKAAGLTEEEKAFISRIAPLLSGKAPWSLPLDEQLVSPPAQQAQVVQQSLMPQNLKMARRGWQRSAPPEDVLRGWLPWYTGRNLAWLAWVRQPDGLRYGIEVEMSGVLARLVPAFPTGMSPGQVLALLDGSGAVVHEVGGAEYRPSLPRLATVELAPALPHWQLVVAGAEGGTTRPLFFALAALLSALLLLALLGGGWLLLREARRSEIEARIKTTFVANVSHELKTPLTTIRMYAEMLGEGRVRDAERRTRYLHVIVQESQRLTRLINNVLDFSRLEQGRKKYNPEALDLSAETRRILDAQMGRLQAAGLAVEVADGAVAQRAWIDRDVFEQALLNLLDNAAKYAAGGGRLTVGVVTDDGRSRVRVRDWGPGIPPTQQRFLFKPFYRLDDALTARQAGTGLGLSISRRLLREQGGDLTYEAAEGGGACFVLELPAGHS